MSNENKGSWMNNFFKSTVGKLAILAGAAVSMSSCTTTTYSNATGYWERTQSSGVSAGQVLQGVAIVGGIATDNNAINKLGGYVRRGGNCYRGKIHRSSCHRPTRVFPVGTHGHHPRCTGQHMGSYCKTY